MTLTLRDVRKYYQSVKAVDGVSFEVKSGELLGLIGPNGAGKSTTIRMVMNIIAPDSGEILFDGKKISDRDFDRIGYLPEERGIYKKFKVSAVLRYFASLKGKSAKETSGKIDEWLEKLGLPEWKERKVEELSKGMSQKVQFIAAVLHDPDIIFLDEPFAGLDPVSSEVIRETVQELSDKRKTIIFSTHIMEQAEKICDSIFLIDKGREVVYGTLDGVKKKFGKNSVIMEFDGDLGFLKNTGLVSDIISYPRWVEIALAPGKTPDDLLTAVAGKESVMRFEVTRPSLQKIFIDLVGGKKAEE
ncbi:ATP-binding cassette domain-containing protein [candidate division WOR-3 bacterium]|nr:ATP-binding cassette domain-containing protein [candidate division WOR-3 bacterium]